MQKILLCVAAICLLTSWSNYSQAQYVWTRCIDNPVLPEWSGNANDPSNLKYAMTPSVLYDSTHDAFRMWFTTFTYAYPNDATLCISNALSFDGEEWYVNIKNPVLEGQRGSWDDGVSAPSVICDGVGYKMYYTGGNYSNITFNIGLATSNEGTFWQRYSKDPILELGPQGSWDSYLQLYCSVYYDSSKYLMWYTATSDNLTDAIGLATSEDGIHWTKYPDNPVFRPSGSGWDSASVYQPTVVVVDQIFYMFYSGTQVPGQVASIGLATSEDGIHWTRHGTEPILTGTGSWESNILAGVSAFYRDNIFHLWYTGQSATTGRWQTGYATSVKGQVGIEGSEDVPQTLALMQCFPNPFNPGTTIRYIVTQKERVLLKVYDVLGREIATIVDEEQTPGEKSVVWNAGNFASGPYFYRLKVGSFIETKKMMLLR